MKHGKSLTEEQFAELLVGRPTAETLADLHHDADAELQLADLKSALHSYRAETLDWAERRAATAPSLLPAARRETLWATVPQWAMAAAGVVTIAVGIGHFSGSAGSARATAVAAESAVSAPAPNLAMDNDLLTSIDAAVSYEGVSPVDGLGLKPSRNDGAVRRNLE